MSYKRIIPCLDVKDGRVVKGIHFLNLRDAGDPVECASIYSKEGADELVLLDITATIEKRGTTVKLVEKIAQEVSISLSVGGGIRRIEDIATLLKSGADKVSIGTAAVRSPDLIKQVSDTFGSKCIIIAIDAKLISESPKKWEVYIESGKTPTGLDVVEWAKKVESLGAGEILLTSIDTDGTKQGYDVDLTRAVTSVVNIPVIASGGAGRLEHFYDIFVRGGADAALAASVFHYGELRIQEVKSFLKNLNIPVRI